LQEPTEERKGRKKELTIAEVTLFQLPWREIGPVNLSVGENGKGVGVKRAEGDGLAS